MVISLMSHMNVKWVVQGKFCSLLAWICLVKFALKINALGINW